MQCHRNFLVKGKLKEYFLLRQCAMCPNPQRTGHPIHYRLLLILQLVV
jgi:hypothetical protein